MKRPKVFIIQIPMWLILSFGLIIPCLRSLRNGLPEEGAISALNGILIVFPILIGMKLITLLLINKIVFVMPRFRKQTEEWVKQTPGRQGYKESQKQLIKASLIVVPLCVLLVIIGINI